MSRSSTPMALAGGLMIGVAVLHAAFGARFGRRPLAGMLSDEVLNRVDSSVERW